MITGVSQGLNYLFSASVAVIIASVARPWLGNGWAFVIGAIVATPIIFTGFRRAATLRRQRFHGRRELSREQFYSTCYANTGIPMAVVCEVLSELEQGGIPAGKALPTDRFDRELAPVEGWEWDDDLSVALDMCVASRMKQAGVSEIATMETLDDLIYRVAELDATARGY